MQYLARAHAIKFYVRDEPGFWIASAIDDKV